MPLFWLLPYFRSSHHEWHDEETPLSSSKSEIKEKKEKTKPCCCAISCISIQLEESKRNCDSYEQKVKKLEARNKHLDKENQHKEIVIAEIKEQQKELLLTQKLLVKQLKVVQDQKNVLEQKLINDRNHYMVVVQHTEDKAHKMAEELQQSKSTVKEMGLFLVLRALCPRYLDPWFFVFSVFYIYSKACS